MISNVSGNQPVSNYNSAGSVKNTPAKSGKQPVDPDVVKFGQDLFTGYGVGVAGELGILTTGAGTYLHENAHAVVIESLFKNAETTIQVDGIDNLKELFRKPSLENLANLITMNDSNKDGAAGVTHIKAGEGLTPLGEHFGTDGSRTLVVAAGSVAQEIPVLGTFMLGYMMKNKSPKIGYSLIALASMQHITNSTYPFSALSASSSTRAGHDWVNFAKLTGVHPLVTAVSFAATLPVLALAMYAFEKAGQKSAARGKALTGLIQQGKISPDIIKANYDKYPNRERLETLQGNLESLMKNNKSEGQIDPAKREQIRKAINALNKEHLAFGNYLIDRNIALIDQAAASMPIPTVRESAQNFAEGVKTSFKKDATGTVLNMGSLAGTVAMAGMNTAHTTAAALGPETAASLVPAMGVLASGVSAVGSLASIWNAGRTLTNPEAGKIDKAAAVSSALFSSLATAGVMVPGLGLPAVITGVAGVLGTQAAKFIAKKFV
ncbi:MAG: hypothetical protein LWY06_08930 [Firmicutes bacterium]|nr:hypothetical protein [Bacillota bacterium]